MPFRVLRRRHHRLLLLLVMRHHHLHQVQMPPKPMLLLLLHLPLQTLLLLLQMLHQPPYRLATMLRNGLLINNSISNTMLSIMLRWVNRYKAQPQLTLMPLTMLLSSNNSHKLTHLRLHHPVRYTEENRNTSYQFCTDLFLVFIVVIVIFTIILVILLKDALCLFLSVFLVFRHARIRREKECTLAHLVPTRFYLRVLPRQKRASMRL